MFTYFPFYVLLARQCMKGYSHPPGNYRCYGVYRGIFTPFAVHYEKIRIHLREKATNSAKIHSLPQKRKHLRVNQIQ